MQEMTEAESHLSRQRQASLYKGVQCVKPPGFLSRQTRYREVRAETESSEQQQLFCARHTTATEDTLRRKEGQAHRQRAIQRSYAGEQCIPSSVKQNAQCRSNRYPPLLLCI